MLVAAVRDAQPRGARERSRTWRDVKAGARSCSRGWNCGVVWLFNFIHSWLKDWPKSLPLLCVGGKVQPESWRGRDLGRTCHPRAAWIGKGMTNTKSSFDALCDSGISTIPDEGVCVQSPSEALRNALWGSM